MSDVFRVRTGFVVFDGGRPRVLKPGELLRGDDPVVSSHRNHLDSIDDVVEQTTAAPGERRPVTRNTTTRTKKDN